mmetsp:Transcript_23697/g.49375  ORF Transcript_23697/g.49375 Transcript_23697/m.49375 type:complete len:247 (+) Transcript_23697:364-1104(+)
MNTNKLIILLFLQILKLPYIHPHPMSTYLPFTLPPTFNLILASTSPRRLEILQTMGLQPSHHFNVIPSPFNEDDPAFRDLKRTLKPDEYVIRGATNKAKAVAEQVAGGGGRNNTVVIGCDTVVEKDGEVMEKPSSPSSAFKMLRALSGSSHSVHTGVCISLVNRDGSPPTHDQFCSTSRVTFNELTDEDIWGYIGTGEPMDKAGGYGIQGIGGCLVDNIDGDFYGIMGLPMGEVAKRLGKIQRELS